MNRRISLSVIQPTALPDCTVCIPADSELIEKTVTVIKNELLNFEGDWVIGFSGGKDSSALLALTYRALLDIRHLTNNVINVIYCDTGVEIPTLSSIVKNTLSALQREALEDEIRLSCTIVAPTLDDRFFVKVIGRGYPPPTNKFRWCTDRLRIKPIRNAMERLSNNRTSRVMLGVRQGESVERNRTIEQYKDDKPYYLRQSGNSNTSLFCPIIDYSVENVWSVLTSKRKPTSINYNQLATLYKDASGECPMFSDAKRPPCGKGRFGCWTCTVVRKDRAVSSMVREGHENLRPLLEWRNWIAGIRDDLGYRCRKRRNGTVGLGPFTLQAREEMLGKLLNAEATSGFQLIGADELQRIAELWVEDRTSRKYQE